MAQLWVGALMTVLVVGGCMRPGRGGVPSKPSPPAQMKALDRMVGTWTGTAELVDPPSPDGKPKTFTGAWKTEPVLDGAAVKSAGWFEMPDGEKVHWIEYWCWDARAKKYRTSFINDWAEFGSGWAQDCGRCNGFRVSGRSINAEGMKTRKDGCVILVDDDTTNWWFTAKSRQGTMTVRGTSKRQK